MSRSNPCNAIVHDDSDVAYQDTAGPKLVGRTTRTESLTDSGGSTRKLIKDEYVGVTEYRRHGTFSQRPPGDIENDPTRDPARRKLVARLHAAVDSGELPYPFSIRQVENCFEWSAGRARDGLNDLKSKGFLAVTPSRRGHIWGNRE